MGAVLVKLDITSARNNDRSTINQSIKYISHAIMHWYREFTYLFFHMLINKQLVYVKKTKQQTNKMEGKKSKSIY